MYLDIPIMVEIRAQSSSGFTRETVERRLCELADRQSGGDDSVEQESLSSKRYPIDGSDQDAPGSGDG